jgi:hypothetical protein
MQAFLEHLLAPTHREAVTFAGLRTPAETADAYRRAAVCVFPSLFDTFSYTHLARGDGHGQGGRGQPQQRDGRPARG